MKRANRALRVILAGLAVAAVILAVTTLVVLATGSSCPATERGTSCSAVTR